MANRKYSDETKEQIVKECHEIGNTALVARQHNIVRRHDFNQ
jgi:transposase-like protein